MSLVTPRTVFIHVPKTGGSSVRALIAAAGIPCSESGPFEIEDHYGLPELRAAHPELERDRLSFGFVRHPVAWLKSRWAWAMVTGFEKKIEREPAAAAHWMASCWSEEFETFAELYLERQAGVATRTMFGMLGVWNLGPETNAIGRCENLVYDLVRALETAGEKFDASALVTAIGSRKKVAASGDYASACAIPRILERAILDAEKPLCERFGYS